jgi:hypothetical protein
VKEGKRKKERGGREEKGEGRRKRWKERGGSEREGGK